MMTTSSASLFASLVQGFFCEQLVRDLNASSQTVASYRDTFRILFRFFEHRLQKQPVALTLADLNAQSILAFLDYLEKDRHNTIRTRNVRFAAIRSFMRYAGQKDPTSLSVIGQVMAIPMKRFEQPLLGYLSREETDAILAAPDDSTWTGHRDRIMFTMFYNTGARVSEIIAMRVGDLSLERSVVNINGKGRKQRTVPLWKSTMQGLRAWLRRTNGDPAMPLFPNTRGQTLSRSGIESRLKRAVAFASGRCPTLHDRVISPHTFRHTTAMHLLQSGIDVTVIALWLGHESPSTTHLYVEADLAMKQKALEKVQEPRSQPLRYKAPDKLLQFLDGL